MLVELLTPDLMNVCINTFFEKMILQKNLKNVLFFLSTRLSKLMDLNFGLNKSRCTFLHLEINVTT